MEKRTKTQIVAESIGEAVKEEAAEQMISMSNMYHIGEIRILPMDKTEEFKTEKEARDYLTTELIEKDGKYYYRERGLDVYNPYALILFQYDASIIGYGILKDSEADGCTGRIDGKIINYKGYFQFFTVSIHNVEKITLNEIRQIDGHIEQFTNAKHHIDIKYYDAIYALLLKKQWEFCKKHCSSSI